MADLRLRASQLVLAASALAVLSPVATHAAVPVFGAPAPLDGGAATDRGSDVDLHADRDPCAGRDERWRHTGWFAGSDRNPRRRGSGDTGRDRRRRCNPDTSLDGERPADTCHPVRRGGSPLAPSGEPTPGPTSGPAGLMDPGAARAAVKCQRAIQKAGTVFVGKRLASLGACTGAVQHCIQIEPDDAGCVTKARVTCTHALGRLGAEDTRFRGALLAGCGGGALELADVLGADGLGYDTFATDCGARARDLDGLVECVVQEHGCQAARLLEVVAPRAKELMRLPETEPASLDTLSCLPDHGGDGENVHDPKGAGRAIERCLATIRKSGATFVRQRLTHLSTCVGTLFACVQLKPGDPRCASKARAICDKTFAKIAVLDQRLGPAIQAHCAEEQLAFATLRAAAAANVDALADACATVGVGEIASLADYQQCVLRQYACRSEELLRFETPRAAEPLLATGRALHGGYCPSAPGRLSRRPGA